tara:strand:+ start:987 stop:1862 length:876 start_codon:yes stop_codon:yes gene_type:complete
LQNNRKGIILAGGTGSRLYPISKAISKQLMPVYDKPMIYYALSTIMLSGTREILIITTPREKNSFKDLLGNGNHLGISIKYATQAEPKGLAEALIIGEKFLNGKPCTLILGDNLFHGDTLVKKLQSISNESIGATIFAYSVNDPDRYGIVEFDNNKKAINIEEKPLNPKTNFAITGLYFYDSSASERAKTLNYSERGELEITDLNSSYLKEGILNVQLLGRGIAWLDTGTPDSLHEASSYIRTLEHRMGFKIGCPEEVSWRMGWITTQELINLGSSMGNTLYGKYLLKITS